MNASRRDSDAHERSVTYRYARWAFWSSGRRPRTGPGPAL